MKRSVFKLMIVAGLALAGEMASAEVLYWKVGNPLIYVNSNKKPEEMKSAAELQYNYARVAAGTYVEDAETHEQKFVASGYLTLLEYDNFDDAIYPIGTSVIELTDGMANPLWADLGEFAGAAYSFQIQLGQDLNGTFDMTAMTDTMTYGQLSDYIAATEYFAHLTNPWSGDGYIVPEPTGGLLFLLGCVVLGLKRKTEVA